MVPFLKAVGKADVHSCARTNGLRLRTPSEHPWDFTADEHAGRAQETLFCDHPRCPREPLLAIVI